MTFEDFAINTNSVGDARETVIFWGEGENLNSFEEGLRSNGYIESYEILADVPPDHRLYRVTFTPEAMCLSSYALVMKHNLVFTDVHGENGTIHARARVHDRDRLKGFLADMGDIPELTIEVDGLYDEVANADTYTSGRFKISPAQRKALELALDTGYFEEPRETTLEELGDELGVSEGAVGGRIRRGVRALVEYYLKQ
ncbi:helix-turn-helix domain-containing protein (plasmid) [Halorarum halophilum]|uniref:Helix-turn-helix domain-containing protein n=1 Tax=Halorarum halophilum TaxID=2743090 RepID=A0A7D5K455_9EURY|nr:helix-turn-helix domain-containing protein [Halobaculum halophilum]QLG30161.1 helix-turn-helix domain-containing protein [Halobaculum halophilum]